MDAAWKSAIRRHRSQLQTGLIVTNFLPSLHRDAGGFLTDVESLRISSKSDSIDQVDELVSILLTKEDEDFDSFCRALKENGYPVWPEKLSHGGAVCNTAKPRPIIHPIMEEYLKVKAAFCGSPHMPSLQALKDHCYDLIDVACTHKPEISRHESAIEKAQTIQKFARILFNHLSQWISFDFLDKVIERFQPELKDVKEQLAEYKKKLQPILMQKLEQIGRFWQQEQEEFLDGLELIEIVAKYRLDADGLEVQDLVTERDFLAQRLGIPESLLKLLSWRPGSIVIVFLILQELQPLVEAALHRSDVLASLTTHGIEDIYLCGHTPDSSDLVSLLYSIASHTCND